MLIIVEGIDRVGKTTLCKMISDEFGMPIFKEDKRQNYNTELLMRENFGSMQSAINMARCTNSNVVFDRFHLTECVYGCIERRYDFDSAFNIFCTIDDLLMKNKDTKLILVRPTNIELSSQMHGKYLGKHALAFDSLFECSKIQNKYACNFFSLQDAIKFIRG